MLAAAYHDFRTRLDDEGIILSYCGYVSEGILTALGEALRQKMATEETDQNVAKRVFSVFVEQVQNVIRYSYDQIAVPPPQPTKLGAGLVMVGAEDGQFFVVCANAISRDRAPKLRERLEKLSAMDKDEIRTYYKEKLREPPEEESEGATIGLIEIARRSSAPIQFDFHDIDDRLSFFCLKAYV